MLSTSEIILQYVCPAFGCVATNMKYSAPVKDVRRAEGLGTLGSLNPTPWAAMSGNCIAWVTYSYLIKNQFIFWANAPGIILSLWLNMVAAKLQYCDRLSNAIRSSFVNLLDQNHTSFTKVKDVHIELKKNLDKNEGVEVDHSETAEKAEAALNDTMQYFTSLRKMAMEIVIQKKAAPAVHEKVVLGVFAAWLAIISVVCFLQLSSAQKEFVVGIAANTNLIFFYGAPLSTMYTVIKTKDSSSIHRWTMALNTANAAFWAAFAIGTKNIYILVPQGTGCFLGLVQIFLCIVMPRRELSALSTEATSGDTQVDSVSDIETCDTPSVTTSGEESEG